MNEIKVISNVGSLTYDFQQLNNEVEVYLEKYQGLVFTDEEIPDAKKIRAELNKVKKDLNARKITVKKEFIAPYTQFEIQVKDIISKVDNVSNEIDLQVKDCEQRSKDEKQNEIEEYFNGFEINYITFNQIFDTQWLNKGCKTIDWQKEIMFIINTIKTNMTIIEGHADKGLLQPIYLKTLNLQAALLEVKEIKDKQSIVLSNEDAISLDTGKTEVDADTGEIVEVEDDYLVREFKVACTRKKLNKLVDFMRTEEIFFEKI